MGKLLTAGQTVTFKMVTFDATRFSEYHRGRIISEGRINLHVVGFMEKEEKIAKFVISMNGETGGLAGKIDMVSGYDDSVFVDNDRILLYINPAESNSDVKLTKHLQAHFPLTRKRKDFSVREPVAVSLFVDPKQTMVTRIEFNLSQPERIIQIV